MKPIFITTLLGIVFFTGCEELLQDLQCDSTYVGKWGLSATGRYSNSNCTGDIDKTSIDPVTNFLNLSADCSYTAEDNFFCDDVNDSNYATMCTGTWSSDGSTVSIISLFTVDYTYSNNQLTSALEVTQGGDINGNGVIDGIEMEPYDECQYSEYTKESSEDDSTTDCTALGVTFVAKADTVKDYGNGLEDDNTKDYATCDAMCDEAVAALQALADNACDMPEMEDDDAPTGTVTQEGVNGFTAGYCGDNGVCGADGLTTSTPSGTYYVTIMIYQDDIDCSGGTNGCESEDCSGTYITFTDNSYVWQKYPPFCDGCGFEDCYETYTTEETCLAVGGAIWKEGNSTGEWSLNSNNEIIGILSDEELLTDQQIAAGVVKQFIYNQDQNTIVFTQIDPTHTNDQGDPAPFCMLATFAIAPADFVLEPTDCAGVAGGTAVVDECGICVGGTTNLTACTQGCATLQTTFVEKADAAQAYDNEAGDYATCDAMCDEAVAALQVLADNACDMPEMEDDDAPTGTVTQEGVNGFTAGFCGDNGVCGADGLTTSTPSGTYYITSMIYHDNIDCSGGTNGCESEDCSGGYITFTDNSYVFQKYPPFCDECGFEDCYETYTTEETCLAVGGAIWNDDGNSTGEWSLNSNNEIIGILSDEELLTDQQIAAGVVKQFIYNQDQNTIVFTQIDPTQTNDQGDPDPFCGVGTFTQGGE